MDLKTDITTDGNHLSIVFVSVCCRSGLMQSRNPSDLNSNPNEPHFSGKPVRDCAGRSVWLFSGTKKYLKNDLYQLWRDQLRTKNTQHISTWTCRPAISCWSNSPLVEVWCSVVSACSSFKHSMGWVGLITAALAQNSPSHAQIHTQHTSNSLALRFRSSSQSPVSLPGLWTDRRAV